MAQILTVSRFWVAGYDFSARLNSLAVTPAVALQEAPAFGDAAMRRIAGLKDARVHYEGYYDADPYDTTILANLGTVNVPVAFAPVDGVEGSVAYMLRAATAEYAPGGAVGEVGRFAVSAEGSAGDRLVRGTILVDATKTLTGTGTAFNLGAVSATQRVYASLHVFAASAGDTLDVTVQSDSAQGFPSPTTRLTFAQKAAIGAEWVSAAGAITDTWWRIAWTIGGASPSFDLVVIVGIQ